MTLPISTYPTRATYPRRSDSSRPTSSRRTPRPSPLQDAILEFLRDFKVDPDNDGNSPSYTDIARALCKYPANIHRYVASMERKGMIRINRRGKIVLIGGKYLPPDSSPSD